MENAPVGPDLAHDVERLHADKEALTSQVSKLREELMDAQSDAAEAREKLAQALEDETHARHEVEALKRLQLTAPAVCRAGNGSEQNY